MNLEVVFTCKTHNVQLELVYPEMAENPAGLFTHEDSPENPWVAAFHVDWSFVQCPEAAWVDDVPCPDESGECGWTVSVE